MLVANLVVWPFAFFAAERYLDNFAQRMTLGPWPFFVALLATLLVAFVAVAGRVLRAARLRPTEALRETSRRLPPMRALRHRVAGRVSGRISLRA